jgi:hypothetical protein
MAGFADVRVRRLPYPDTLARLVAGGLLPILLIEARKA